MSTRSYVLPAREAKKPSAQLLGESSVVALAETFKVLGDVTRLRILDALARVRGTGVPGLPNALCVQDLANALGMTHSAVSHQLRLLRSMRLVRTRRDGRQIFYALDDDHIVKLFEQGLEHVNEQTAPARPGGPKRAAPRQSPRQPRLRSAVDAPERSAGGPSERDARATRTGVGSPPRALEKVASVSARGGATPREIKR